MCSRFPAGSISDLLRPSTDTADTANTVDHGAGGAVPIASESKAPLVVPLPLRASRAPRAARAPRPPVGELGVLGGERKAENRAWLYIVAFRPHWPAEVTGISPGSKYVWVKVGYSCASQLTSRFRTFLSAWRALGAADNRSHLPTGYRDYRSVADRGERRRLQEAFVDAVVVATHARMAESKEASPSLVGLLFESERVLAKETAIRRMLEVKLPPGIVDPRLVLQRAMAERKMRSGRVGPTEFVLSTASRIARVRAAFLNPAFATCVDENGESGRGRLRMSVDTVRREAAPFEDVQVCIGGPGGPMAAARVRKAGTAST